MFHQSFRDNKKEVRSRIRTFSLETLKSIEILWILWKIQMFFDAWLDKPISLFVQ